MSEGGLIGGIAMIVFHVLPPKMKQIEIALARCEAFQQTKDGAIVLAAKHIAMIKTELLHLWIIQEERTVEIDASLRNGVEELIGEKGNLEFCSLEQGWKEDAFRPSASFICTLGGEKGSESIAGDVPRRNDIIEDYQFPTFCPLTESRCRRQAIPIERSMVFVVTFADNHHDVWATLFCHVQNRQMLHACFQDFCFMCCHTHEMKGLNAAIIGGKEFRFRNRLRMFSLAIRDELQHLELMIHPYYPSTTQE